MMSGLEDTTPLKQVIGSSSPTQETDIVNTCHTAENSNSAQNTKTPASVENTVIPSLDQNASTDGSAHNPSNPSSVQNTGIIPTSTYKTAKPGPTQKMDKVTFTRETDKVNPSQVTDKINPTRETDKVNLARETDKVNSTQVTDKINPTREMDKVNSTQEMDKVNPTLETDKVNPSRETDKVNPTQVTDKVNPTRETDKINPTQEMDKVNPTLETDKVNPSRETDKVNPTQKTDNSVLSQSSDKNTMEHGKPTDLSVKEGNNVRDEHIRSDKTVKWTFDNNGTKKMQSDTSRVLPVTISSKPEGTGLPSDGKQEDAGSHADKAEGRSQALGNTSKDTTFPPAIKSQGSDRPPDSKPASSSLPLDNLPKNKRVPVVEKDASTKELGVKVSAKNSERKKNSPAELSVKSDPVTKVIRVSSAKDYEIRRTSTTEQTSGRRDVTSALQKPGENANSSKSSVNTARADGEKTETTFSVVNENEKTKTSKVKWSTKTDMQDKDMNNVPNGLILKDNKQEKDNPTDNGVVFNDKKKEKISGGNGDTVVKENDKKSSSEVKEEKKKEFDSSQKNTKQEDVAPRSILTKAAWKKIGKDKPGYGPKAADNKQVLNGPHTVKTQSKASLAVPSPVPGSRDHSSDERDDRLSIGSRRDSTKFSLDSVSRKSVDYRMQNTTVVNPPVEEKPKSVLTNNDSWIRSAIPYLPIGLSVFCLFLNILIPGSGTVLSGFAILCCGKPRVPTKDDHVPITLCVNVWVGVAQLFTVTFCFVGWFWSVAWGIKMVILSVEYRRELKQQREKELQTMALSAFGSPVHVRPLFPGV